MRSLSITVRSRWATVSTVHSRNWTRIDRWISSSVLQAHRHTLHLSLSLPTRSHSRIVHVRCGFIDDQDLALLQNRSCQTHQLLLTHTQIAATLAHQRLQTLTHHITHQSLQLHLLECQPDLGIGIVTELIEIASHRASEEHRILWNDRDASSDIVESESGDVDVIDVNVTIDESAHAKESLDERALASACSSDDANLFAGRDAQGDVRESEWSLWIFRMRHADIGEPQMSLWWPVGRWSAVGRDLCRWFLIESTVLENTLDRCHLCLYFNRLSRREKKHWWEEWMERKSEVVEYLIVHCNRPMRLSV